MNLLPSLKITAYYVYKLLPDSFRSKLDVYRKKEHLRKTGVVFIHIPKNAGSGISKSLYGRYFGHYRLSDYVSVLGKEVENFSIFSIYRDPVERFVSSYKYAKGVGGDRKPSKKAQKNVSAFNDINEFVESIEGVEYLYGLDVIFWPQTYFLNPEEVIRHGIIIFDIKDEQGYQSLLEGKGFSYSGVHNSSSESNVGLDERLKTKIKEIYSADYALSELIKK